MEIIGIVPKNVTERIEIRNGNYKGFERVDIRIFAAGENGWYPTKRGVSLAAKNIKQLIQILESIQE